MTDPKYHVCPDCQKIRNTKHFDIVKMVFDAGNDYLKRHEDTKIGPITGFGPTEDL